jgi:hypothetical protein
VSQAVAGPGLAVFGTTVFTAVFFVATAKIAIDTRQWTKFVPIYDRQSLRGLSYSSLMAPFILLGIYLVTSAGFPSSSHQGFAQLYHGLVGGTTP